MQIWFTKSVVYRGATEGEVSQVFLYKCKTFLLVSQITAFQYNIKCFYLKADYMGDIGDAKGIKYESLTEMLITAVNQNRNEQ